MKVQENLEKTPLTGFLISFRDTSPQRSVK